MKNNLAYISWFFILVVLQVLLFNNLSIAGYVNIYIYIYFILFLPQRMDRAFLLFLGFILGLSVDLLSNTWGIHAAATTLIAYLRPYVLRLSGSQEDQERLNPSLYSMGMNFWKFSAILVVAHHFVLLSLEAFSLQMMPLVLLKVVVSSFLTLLLVWTFEKLRN